MLNISIFILFYKIIKTKSKNRIKKIKIKYIKFEKMESDMDIV